MALSSKYVSVLNQASEPLDGAVSLGTKLSALFPTYFIALAGNYTTLGGSATEAASISGVLSTDIAIVSLKSQGETPRTILTAAPSADTLTIVFSGDPSTDHVVSYMILREVS